MCNKKNKIHFLKILIMMFLLVFICENKILINYAYSYNDEDTKIEVDIGDFGEDEDGNDNPQDILDEGAYSNADNGNREFEDKSTDSIKDGFNKFLVKYKNLVAGISGLIVMTLVVWLIIQFCMIGNYTDNPRMKGTKTTQLVLTILAIAILGSFTVWFSVFYNAFR